MLRAFWPARRHAPLAHGLWLRRQLAPLAFALTLFLRRLRRLALLGRRGSRRLLLATTVAQDEVLHRVDIHRLDAYRATPGRMSTGGAQPDQIGAQAIDAGSEAALADLAQHRVIQRDIGQALAGIAAALGESFLLALPALQEGCGIGIEGQASADDLGALGRLRLAIEGQVEAETVEQLRAQLALLGIHGANQHEARGMPMGDAVTLDMVDPAGSGIEQQIDQMVGQQVDLIDIEHAAVGTG